MGSSWEIAGLDGMAPFLVESFDSGIR